MARLCFYSLWLGLEGCWPSVLIDPSVSWGPSMPKTHSGVLSGLLGPQCQGWLFPPLAAWQPSLRGCHTHCPGCPFVGNSHLHLRSLLSVSLEVCFMYFWYMELYYRRSFVFSFCFSRFIYVVACTRISSCFMAELYAIAYICNILFTHFIDGHLSCFYILATGNTAAVTTGVQVSVWVSFQIFWLFHEEWVTWLVCV